MQRNERICNAERDLSTPDARCYVKPQMNHLLASREQLVIWSLNRAFGKAPGEFPLAE